jgi:tRNA 2-thiouridine synthesizing protein E
LDLSPLQLLDGSALLLDERGFLVERERWTPAVAEALAGRDGVVLEADHWVMMNLLRDYFDEFQVEPPMRALLQRLRQQTGDPDWDSRRLYRLFPQGPVREGSRYAGLPIPLSCI